MKELYVKNATWKNANPEKFLYNHDYGFADLYTEIYLMLIDKKERENWENFFFCYFCFQSI